ncbi:MAG: SPOR domain-containing protein [Nitrospirae bacterium]|nr:SPOR domain-containing protein [Nitrospirota bacterium]
MRDLDNLKEPSEKHGSKINFARASAMIILLFGLLAGAFLAWRATTSAPKEPKKPDVQIPVTKKNPEPDLTFYKNLKDKNETENKKEQIVGLIPPSASRPAPSGGQTSGFAENPVSPRFTLQVGSMKDYQKALLLSEKLVKKGFPSYVISAEIPQRGIYYRIRVGHYVTRKAAEKVLEQLKRQGEAEVILARENVMTRSR